MENVNNKNNKPPSPLMLSGPNCIKGTGSAMVIVVGVIVKKLLLEKLLIIHRKMLKLFLRRN